MRRIPHFALRGLFRQAGAATDLAERMDRAEKLVRWAFVDLAGHPLVAQAAVEQLAFAADTATPLQRAMAQISRQGPPEPAAARARSRGGAVALQRAAPGMGDGATEGPVAADPTRRVKEILDRLAPSPPPPEPPEGRPASAPVPESAAMGTARRSPVDLEPRPAAARPSSVATAREIVETWIERAGPGSDRPVSAAGWRESLIADLIAGRGVPTAALIQAAVPSPAAKPPDGGDVSPLERTATQLGVALDRISARQPAPGPMLPTGAPGAPVGIGMRSERADNRAPDPVDDTVSGLRRLAMRTGAGVRPAAGGAGDRPTPMTGADPLPARPTVAPETDDRTLASRLAEILEREARRHGIETEEIEP